MWEKKKKEKKRNQLKPNQNEFIKPKKESLSMVGNIKIKIEYI